MGCRKEIARGIVDRGADCLPAAKEDRGQLCRDVGSLFEAGDGAGLDGSPHGCATTLNRGRGRIENSLHRSIDVTFREGQSRVRRDRGPRNMAALRQISRNLLKLETGLRAGIQGKPLQAGWREDCLLKVLLA